MAFDRTSGAVGLKLVRAKGAGGGNGYRPRQTAFGELAVVELDL